LFGNEEFFGVFWNGSLWVYKMKGRKWNGHKGMERGSVHMSRRIRKRNRNIERETLGLASIFDAARG